MASVVNAALFFVFYFVSIEYNFMAAHLETSSYNLFARELLSVISKSKPTQNIVYSPASIYNFLTFLYYGAEGQTKEEIGAALKLDQEDKERLERNRVEYFKKHLKALNPNWLHPFNAAPRLNAKINRNGIKAVRDSMSSIGFFKYAKLPDLNATALEIDFKNSKISLMILLPDEIESLELLESRLATMDLNDISSMLKLRIVAVFLPKFRIEFKIDLKEPLERMGCSTLFKEDANFTTAYNRFLPEVLELNHKASLELKEAGLMANATTDNYESDRFHKNGFRPERSFVFFIRSKTMVYFAGHIGEF